MAPVLFYSQAQDLPEHEKLVSCPYNKAHKVVSHRLPKHLIKCRRSHLTTGTRVCRFNVTHVYPIEEIDFHEESCPDRLLVEMFVLRLTDDPEEDEPSAEVEVKEKEYLDKSFMSEMVSSANASIGTFCKDANKKSNDKDDEDEDWSDECVPTYNPAAATKNRVVRKHFQNMLPSQLKMKREENKMNNKEIIEKNDMKLKEKSSRSAESVYTVIGSGLNSNRNPNINWTYAGEFYSRKADGCKAKK